MVSKNIFDRIEQHITGPTVNIARSVPMVLEHGFAGVCVKPDRVPEAVNAISKQIEVEFRPSIVTVFDGPYGEQSCDVRVYSVHSAKERGADVIEVFAPYRFICEKNVQMLSKDINSICSSAKACNIEIRYAFDLLAITQLSQETLGILNRQMRNSNLDGISLYFGCVNELDISDTILTIRDMKRMTRKKIKVYVDTDEPERVSMFIKAGVDIIGIPGTNNNIVYDYRDLLQNAD